MEKSQRQFPFLACNNDGLQEKLMIGNKKLGLHDTYYANSCFLSSIPKDYAYITNRIRIKKIRNMIGTKIIFSPSILCYKTNKAPAKLRPR